MSIYRDDGIVLRTQKLGEADRIVTVLARRVGPGQGRGQGRPAAPSRRFGARLEPFTHVDLLLYTGQEPGRDHSGRDRARLR